MAGDLAPGRVTRNSRHIKSPRYCPPSPHLTSTRLVTMWRRFSWSTTDNNTKPQLSETVKDPAPAPPNPPSDTAITAKSATAPLNPPPSAQKPTTNQGPVATAMKEHELPSQRPMGWGQRRRSSILEKLGRETTKEGKCCGSWDDD